MFDKIANIIASRGLKPADCAYHTMRTLENNGKVRALVIKGDPIAHIECICPKCGHYEYRTQPWAGVGKAAKVRFSVKCAKCGLDVKIEKLKGKSSRC